MSLNQTSTSCPPCTQRNGQSIFPGGRNDTESVTLRFRSMTDVERPSLLTPNASRCLADFGILDEVAADAVTPQFTRVRHGQTQVRLYV